MAYASVAMGLAAAFCWGTADYMSRSQSERVWSYRTITYSRMVTLIVVLVLIPKISPNLAFPVYPVSRCSEQTSSTSPPSFSFIARSTAGWSPLWPL